MSESTFPADEVDWDNFLNAPTNPTSDSGFVMSHDDMCAFFGNEHPSNPVESADERIDRLQKTVNELQKQLKSQQQAFNEFQEQLLNQQRVMLENLNENLKKANSWMEHVAKLLNTRRGA
ncbi:hypothetical protein FPQ18DRAFT_401193 [Pyronema domesticum]|nr:hypothetical protein FPQ18DRAFT_401188 [Pyronema domesticum]KAI5794684.1 hypothetical protein FPQ18DRAFT_401193 [Pyronema domesticum]